MVIDFWNNFWKYKHYSGIVEIPPKILYGGTYTEPLASIGMSHFLEPCKDKFKEGFSILDYGCGAGILSNFISERLSMFNYYGLEVNSSHGKERLKIARNYLTDDRNYFGLIDENLEYVLNQKIDCVVLISIFTHLQIEDIVKIIYNLKTVFDKNKDAKIVFSCFISNINKVDNYQPHIFDRFYGKSYIVEQDLEYICNKNRLKLTKCFDFIAQGNHVHNIYSIEKINK